MIEIKIRCVNGNVEFDDYKKNLDWLSLGNLVIKMHL